MYRLSMYFTQHKTCLLQVSNVAMDYSTSVMDFSTHITCIIVNFIVNFPLDHLCMVPNVLTISLPFSQHLLVLSFPCIYYYSTVVILYPYCSTFLTDCKIRSSFTMFRVCLSQTWWLITSSLKSKLETIKCQLTFSGSLTLCRKSIWMCVCYSLRMQFFAFLVPDYRVYNRCHPVTTVIFAG